MKSEVKYTPISVAALGDNTLVAAVPGKKIRVLGVSVVAGVGANNIRFESAAGGTALTGVVKLPLEAQYNLPINGIGWFETNAGELLNLELSSAVSMTGCLVYQEVD